MLIVLRRLTVILLLVSAAMLAGQVRISDRLASALSGPHAEEDVAEAMAHAIWAALGPAQPERPFPIGGGVDRVAAWQQHIIGRLRERTRIEPEVRLDVSSRILQTERIGRVRRTLLSFTSWDGTAVPAYVHEPTDGGNRGAVLIVPGHGAGIRALAGLANDYQHAAALELANRGYVTLTPELRGFGMLAPDGVSTHSSVALAALEAGSFYKALVVQDLSRALTVLQRWQGVAPERIAVAGTSLGAEIAVLFAAVDSRPRVVLSHSYGAGLGPVPAGVVVADGTRQTPHGCHIIPGINSLLHREDWFRLLAPRAVQVVRGTGDLSSRASLHAFRAAAMEGFAPFHAEERLEVLEVPGGHEFFLDLAVRFLARWL